MLDEAGQKPGKDDRRIKAAREAVINKVMSKEEKKTSGFADPAVMFK